MRWLVAFLIASAATRAVADTRESVALASSDASFRAALADVLAASGTTVVPADDASPPSLADLTAGSRALADREHATATVWLIAAPNGSTLVAYDRAVDRVLVRELAYAVPLTRSQAAEAARMTRTMLRALRAMPESEPKVVAPPPPPIPPPPPPIAIERPPVASASLGLGLHVLAPGSDAQPAATIAGTWRPDRLGATLAATLAPSSDLFAAAFTGEVRDTTLAACIRLPLRVAPRIAVGAQAGAALHVVHLEGTLVDGETVDQTSVDPALRLGADAVYEVDPELSFGFAVSADTLLARQIFEAGSDRVLAVSRVQLVAGIIATLRIL
ncbi:MAG: hypothetical protein ACM31C_20975 [Acidobacteriota bacterium]